MEQIYDLQENNEEYHSSFEEDLDPTFDDGEQIIWKPAVPDAIKPKLLSTFASLDEAIKMYTNYAEIGGFEVRLGTRTKNSDKSTRLRYVLCSKYGEQKSRTIDSMSEHLGPKKKRKTKFKVTGCKACVKFQCVEGTTSFFLYHFEENHNHPLLRDDEKAFSRKRRQLDSSDTRLIINVSKSNLGALKAHRIQVSLKGGPENVGCDGVDYKNFWRDIIKYIGNKDAQMLINMMESRRLHSINFTYEYLIEDKQLKRLFWSDDISKANYEEFGDVISMDATYRTNKYAMIFVPITGVDNHKRSYIIAAALLDGESIESYKWMLEAFLRSHKRQPRIILTDQDPSLIQAIPFVFPKATHRLCMWHIMNKVNSKVCSNVPKNKDFKSLMHKLVWNVYLDIEEFEERWSKLIDEFQLQDNKWLCSIYEIRKTWIPAYFRHIPLCGLMKTTSRSESSNSYFNTYSRSENTFVNFMVCFDTALEKQRYKQRAKDFETRTTLPEYLTKLKIERHAATLYTRAVFLDVQTEIYKSNENCYQWSVDLKDGIQTFIIIQKKKTKQKLQFKVVTNQHENTFVCSCFRFQYHGILCRHIFTVFSNLDIEEIPLQYVTRRWRKDVILPDLLHKCYRYMESNDEIQKMVKEGYLAFDDCIQRLMNDKVKMESFLRKIQALQIEVQNDETILPTLKKKDAIIKSLFGISQPESVEINVPTGIKNKGCGTGKRLVGVGEKIAKQSSKKKRKCKKCGKVDYHDSRNCTENSNKE